MCTATGKPQLARERRRGPEQRVGHRVRRVRRDADSHERRLARAHGEHLLAQLGDGALALRRIGTEGLAIADAAHAALQHGLEAAAGVTGVGEGRDAGAHALLDAEARRVEQIVVREHGAPRVRETEDPLAEARARRGSRASR